MAPFATSLILCSGTSESQGLTQNMKQNKIIDQAGLPIYQYLKARSLQHIVCSTVGKRFTHKLHVIFDPCRHRSPANLTASLRTQADFALNLRLYVVDACHIFFQSIPQLRTWHGMALFCVHGPYIQYTSLGHAT